MNKQFCQSCAMPLANSSMSGTNADGSPSQEYCRYCFEKGSFTEPMITLEQMTKKVDAALTQMKVPADIKEKTKTLLPLLKRWQRK
jgi:hypothetical protein